MSDFSRRKLITTGLAATAGVVGLGAAARIAEKYGLVPPDHGGIYGVGETLTYASQRLLTRHSLPASSLAARFPRFPSRTKSHHRLKRSSAFRREDSLTGGSRLTAWSTGPPASRLLN